MRLKIGDEHIDVGSDFIQAMEEHCKDVLAEYYMAIPNDVDDEEYVHLRRATQQCRLEFWRKWNDTVPDND